MSNNTTITAGVQSGVVFKSTSTGTDPDFANVTGLLPDCQYLRLKNSDGTYAYVALNEIDLLRTEMESKASAIEVELMQSDIDDKATKSQLEEVRNLAEANVVDEEVIDSILQAIENKAEKTVVEGIAAEMLTKADIEDMDSLAELVDDKASKKSVDDLVADLDALKTALGGITDANVVAAIQNQINYLNDEINKRLTIDDIRSLNTSVTAMNTTVNTLNEKVDGFESRLNGTASSEGVTAVTNSVASLTETVNRLETKINTKADAGAIAGKASHEELLAVAKKVTTLTTTVNDKVTDFNDAINDVNNALAGKVGVTTHTVAMNDINEKLDKKADKNVLGPQLQQVERDLNKLKADLEDLEGAVGGVDFQPQIDSLSRTISSINTKLTEQTNTTKNMTKTVDKLSAWKDETAKNLKSQWVRVLSSKEYKALRPAGENTLQDYNPRYRYPNTVYLVVDFNKPKAIYIGDILVAQAESKGSIGFAYTFPIAF
jgi:hypothetical protein